MSVRRCRCLSLKPFPQVTEQGLHAPKSDHWQSWTTSEKIMFYKTWTYGLYSHQNFKFFQIKDQLMGSIKNGVTTFEAIMVGEFI